MVMLVSYIWMSIFRFDFWMGRRFGSCCGVVWERKFNFECAVGSHGQNKHVGLWSGAKFRLKSLSGIQNGRFSSISLWNLWKIAKKSQPNFKNYKIWQTVSLSSHLTPASFQNQNPKRSFIAPIIKLHLWKKAFNYN